MRTSFWLAGAALCAALAGGPARAAVSADNFLLRDTGDLVTLCSADRSDPLYTAASNFCHGFAVGVYRVLAEEDGADPALRLFCLPDPEPTRTQALAAFILWAKSNAPDMTKPATDGIALFLSEQYPCPGKR
jgi:Rap1a immunity proteins